MHRSGATGAWWRREDSNSRPSLGRPGGRLAPRGDQSPRSLATPVRSRTKRIVHARCPLYHLGGVPEVPPISGRRFDYALLVGEISISGGDDRIRPGDLRNASLPEEVPWGYLGSHALRLAWVFEGSGRPLSPTVTYRHSPRSSTVVAQVGYRSSGEPGPFYA